ncbi:MAG: alpha-mannosidase [Cyanobacteria bacterium P01_G01_bin.39]
MSSNSITIIEQAIAKLRQLVQLEIQRSWRNVDSSNMVDISSNLAQVNLSECNTIALNEKGYIVFPKGRQVKWLAQKITIPQTLQGYPLSGLSCRLVLTWWAEDAQIFINGELVQQGDLFDSSARVLITKDAQQGQEYLVTIRLVSPNHDIGALMRSHLIYEKSDIFHQIDPGLVADELSILFKYSSQFAPQHLDILAAELDKFNWSNLENAHKFGDDLAQLRLILLPLAKNIKQRCFHLLGHAHLDMAWLWTTDETYEVAERTFRSVLNLQQDFPTLTFGHTSPALYQWLENNRPELFQQIQCAVRSNKWELLGGMWIEPETNLVSGESLIRQLLYGQRYYQEKFDQISQVAWLPDSFGFTWQLPQIMQQCGIEYFVTGKLHWNDTTQFPHGCFWWESPDGTQLLTLMSPPNLAGVMDTNPITMTDYALDWETQTGFQDIFWLPGVGDHGGGPTQDMLEVADKWNNSPFFPEIKFSTAVSYLEKLTQSSILNVSQRSPQVLAPQSSLPVWQDELYFEFHRGCYTVHADQKKYNRYCERLLYQAELWSTLATLVCRESFVSQPLFSSKNTIVDQKYPGQESPVYSDQQYQNPTTTTYEKSFSSLTIGQTNPQQLIEIAWKKILFNQFHDILPGTSIPEVFTEANQDWEAAITIGENLLQTALKAIALNIKLPNPPSPNAAPLVVFNSLNWQRSEIVTIENKKFSADNLVFWVCDAQGQRIPSSSDQAGKLSFFAQDIPGIGYSLYYLCHKEVTIAKAHTINSCTNYQLENTYLKVVVNPETGNLDSIFDKISTREILNSAANKLQAYEDRGQYWDAWNIDPEYETKQLSETELASIEWVENSKTKQIIRVIKRLNQSQFIQDYILEYDAPILKIANTVDWQETHVMVKAVFPLNIHSDHVTYEIPCGTIERTTKPKTAAEKAKWEVSALNWADITDNEGRYGVSLINDCKYGYDAKPDRLRLTLLRSSTWPDSSSDRGIHHFSYGIYPHQYSWRESKTVQKGYEFNTPLQTVMINRHQQNNQDFNQLLTKSEFLNLSADNLVLMALKPSHHQDLIMRCYETHGSEAQINLKSDLDFELNTLLDCLERENTNDEIVHQIKPHKIATFRLKKVDRQ